MAVSETVRQLSESYHEHVYTRLADALRQLTDSTDACITDLFLPLAAHSTEMLLVLILITMFNIAKNTPQVTDLAQVQEVVKILSEAFCLPIPIVLSLAMAAFGINYFRQPISEKLGLKLEPINVTDEVHYLVEQLNTRVPQQVPPEIDIVAAMNSAVDVFFDRLDGYHTPTSKKVKHTKFPKILTHNFGAAGLYDFWIHEVVLAHPIYLPFYPHERAHSKGVPLETQAEIAGIISMIESDDRYLQYLGYRIWLQNTYAFISQKIGETLPLGKDVPFIMIQEYLRNAGLNTQTLHELREYVEFENTILQSIPKISQYLQQKTRDLLLAVLRQKNTRTAYAVNPVKYLGSYRRQRP